MKKKPKLTDFRRRVLRAWKWFSDQQYTDMDHVHSMWIAERLGFKTSDTRVSQAMNWLEKHGYV